MTPVCCGTGGTAFGCWPIPCLCGNCASAGGTLTLTRSVSEGPSLTLRVGVITRHRDPMHSLLVALAFLTVLPVRLRELPSPQFVARSRFWFPVVGLLLGGLLGGWMALLSAWLPARGLAA